MFSTKMKYAILLMLLSNSIFCQTNNLNKSLSIGISVFKAGSCDFLADSLFVFKNIQNSLIVNKFRWSMNVANQNSEAVFVDSIPLIPLNVAQKRQLIVPVMFEENKNLPISSAQDWDDSIFVNDTFFVKNIVDLDVFWVSKQKKIGEMTPIIVWITGEKKVQNKYFFQYEGLYYILVDKNCVPISHFFLSGLGAYTDQWSTTTTRHSLIKGNEIISYKLTATGERQVFVQSIHPVSYDSVSYISKILTDGRFETKLLKNIHTEKWIRTIKADGTILNYRGDIIGYINNNVIQNRWHYPKGIIKNNRLIQAYNDKHKLFTIGRINKYGIIQRLVTDSIYINIGFIKDNGIVLQHPANDEDGTAPISEYHIVGDVKNINNNLRIAWATVVFFFFELDDTCQCGAGANEDDGAPNAK